MAMLGRKEHLYSNDATEQKIHKATLSLGLLVKSLSFCIIISSPDVTEFPT